MQVRVYLLPVGVFGVTISNVLFPSISKAAANNDKEGTNRSLVSALNFLNFLTIPSLFVLTFFSKDVIRLIFSYGKFNEEAVKNNCRMLTILFIRTSFLCRSTVGE